MRSKSKKTAARERACEAFRRKLRVEVGRCEVCGVGTGASSGRWPLAVHEISRGPNRQKALDQPFAMLVVCFFCHMERIHGNEHWPEARQLTYLRNSRPEDYDLAAYNRLIGRGPNRITEDEVNEWENHPRQVAQ